MTFPGRARTDALCAAQLTEKSVAREMVSIISPPASGSAVQTSTLFVFSVDDELAEPSPTV
jgi:hypothetical protein